jgi:cellulose synthase/poly-beta-1,6-N-acetylglucosamine synthase-like glycosyltransferase
MTNEPRVSAVMTIRAESPARVERALASVRAQDYSGSIEIVVAAPPGEPAPADGTVVANPTGKRSPGLNLAAAAATGDIVVRVDARSVLPPDYVRRCVARLQSDPSIGVVGGVQRAAVPESSDVVARGIARALRNRWTTGGASYRRTGASGSVDTVYLGVFRRDELLAVGGYDVSLDANEDFDLCQRYLARGQQVWLEEGLAVDYEGRTRLADVWRQYVAFGEAKVQYWRMRHERPNGRQLVGLLGPVVGLVAFGGAVLAGRGAVAVVGGIAGVAALDQVAVGGKPSLGERAVSIVGSNIVPIAWAVGAYREFVRR